MPAPGEQHTPWANPFEEPKPRVTEWTAKEIATIASKLDKQLGPEYISSRSGPGGSRVHYLTAEKVIGLANEVFGFNGWSSSIQNIQVDFADENPQTQRVSIGLSVIVRITLRDGTYHEDIGYGSIENAKGKAMAFEKAKKEGTTDGMKRALRSFGNVLGNCIYDTDYVKQVTKVKAQPVKKFDQDNLHRHTDFIKREAVASGGMSLSGPSKDTVSTKVAALKLEPSESFEDFLGELDEADFCVPGEGHPDETVLPNPAQAQLSLSKQPPNNNPGQAQAHQSNQAQPPRTASGGTISRLPQTPHAANAHTTGSHRNSPQISDTAFDPGPPLPGPAAQSTTFFSARSVAKGTDTKASAIVNPQIFNPKAESPSIRKTPGIDHSSSRPVARNGQHVVPTSSESTNLPSSSANGFTPVRPGGPVTRSSLVNPSLDQTRRIGAPSGPGSPLANRGSYKPPTMKRPLAVDAANSAGSRPPLSDLPTNANAQGHHMSAGAAATEELDAKRQKTA